MPEGRFLVWVMAATFAAMGGTAGTKFRTTGTRPGFSAIIGLLGAARGLSRTDDFRSLERLSVAVGTFSAGTSLSDYHTVQSVPEKACPHPVTRKDALEAAGHEAETKPTVRDYRVGVVYGVAVRDPVQGSQLSDLQKALLDPVFPLYFGRKSCLFSHPLRPKVVKAKGFVEAIRKIERKDLPEWAQKLALSSVAQDTGDFGPQESNLPVYEERAHDIPLDRQAWHFGSRRVAIVSPNPESSREA